MSPRNTNCGLCGHAALISSNNWSETIDASSMMIVDMDAGNGFSALRPGSNLIDRLDDPSSCVIHTSTGAYSSSLWMVIQHGCRSSDRFLRMLLVARRVNATMARPGLDDLRYLCSARSGVIEPLSISA